MPPIYDHTEEARRWRLAQAVEEYGTNAHEAPPHDQAWRDRLAAALRGGNPAGHGGSGFDPNQPRVPAGHPDGGQWTSAGGGHGTAGRTIVRDSTGRESWSSVLTEREPDGAVAHTMFNRDGSAIRSTFSAPGSNADWDERHTVLLPDGSLTTFENSGLTQTIYDGNARPVSVAVMTAEGPEPQAILQPAFWQAPAARLGQEGVRLTEKAITDALAFFTYLSSRNGPDGKAVFAFRANEFLPGEKKGSEAIWVGRLTETEVREACPRYGEVQGYTNSAANSVDRREFDTPAKFGTEVHWRVQVMINGHDSFKLPPRDYNFRAELSLLKTREARYGLKDSRRIDVFENPQTGTVCIYDIKTGRKGLSFARIQELASTAPPPVTMATRGSSSWR
jgi:hypothetical protein